MTSLESQESHRELERMVSALVGSVAALSELHPPVPAVPGTVPPVPAYGPDAAEDLDLYQLWLTARAARRDGQRRETRGRVATLRRVPSMSVLVPVQESDFASLGRCVASALDQDLQQFEVWLSTVGAGGPELELALREVQALDDRVRISRGREGGGRPAAVNRAASLATGDFLAFLDQDDELEPGALAEVVLALAKDGEIDVLYTDEDRLDRAGARREPFFKPDWAPDQLLSHMYMGRLLVVRRSLFETLDGLRLGAEGIEDYDLALRATEKARKVAHLPEVAYHRRTVHPPMFAAQEVLAEALERRGEEAAVEPGLVGGTFRVRRGIRHAPRVSVIVPFRDGAELLRRCVTSLQETAGYDQWEALLVDNGSWEPETRAVLDRLTRDSRCRVLAHPGEFNWSAINNDAARQCSGEHLLFLNADVEGRAEGWLAAMLEHSQRAEVGAVGARLLYPDGRVQHAGVVLGLGGGVAWHAFCFCPDERPGYFGQAKVVRNCSAVTGACMMVRRGVFESVGGFDEGLPVAYNDVDFCLRLGERGYRVVYTPFAELYHAESVWRGRASRPHPEAAAVIERWRGRIAQDPFFNPNLDLRRSEFTVPADGRRSSLDRTWCEHARAG